jgi:anti-sigma factor RsiW
MHCEWTDTLSAYLDGELPPDTRAAVSAHLADCAECRLALDELTRIVEAARSITPKPPATDLWSGIAGRLTPASTAGPSLAGPEAFATRASAVRRASLRRISFTLPQLAAASICLAAVSGGVAWTLHRPPAAAGPAAAVATVADQSDAGAASARSDAAHGPSVATVSFADAQYDAAVADLERTLSRQRGRLDASTVTIVERNLQIIDSAISQARQALEADPANSYLSSHLVETRRRKLDLLRRAAALSESN